MQKPIKMYQNINKNY